MNFLEKRNKISILQDRANIYNYLQDAQQEDQIQQQLDLYTTLKLAESKQQFNNTYIQPKPPVSVLTTSGLLSLGLDQYPKMTTSFQDSNKETEQRLRNYKQNGVPPGYKEDLTKQQAEDQYRQQILFKNDHLREFEIATDQGYKQHNSRYKQEHNLNPEMRSMIDDYKHRNNLKKNDLNTFFNVFIKHKSTLRK